MAGRCPERPAGHPRGWLAWAGLLVLLLGSAVPARAGPGDPAIGARLYVEGITPDGQAVQAQRSGGGPLAGRDAACTQCHRNSGLGTFEGAVQVPPVAWNLLSRPAASLPGDTTVPHPLGLPAQRPAYTLASLQRALVDGVAADGHPLSWVMPRYTLDAVAVTHLQAYLATLAASAPAGARDGQLVFGFVATPGADPAMRDLLVAMLERGFALHNRTLGGTAGPRSGGARTWRLQVLPLQGPAARWAEELGRLLARSPVFAVAGGIGPGDWTPIDHACAQAGVPLLFPAIEAPPLQPQAQALFFHRGVTLEAHRMAVFLQQDALPPLPVWQVAAAGDSGEGAAATLAGLLAGQFEVHTRALAAGEAPASALPPMPADCVVWLRGAALAPWLRAGRCRRVLLSGVLLPDLPDPLAGQPVDAALDGHLWLTYPWELPDRRRVAMNFPQGWTRQQGLPWQDARLQSDAWLLLQILEATLADLQDAYFPQYLVERAESLVGHRHSNAGYPRLTLAPGQQFASKGAYLLRWQATGGWQAVEGWVSP